MQSNSSGNNAASAFGGFQQTGGRFTSPLILFRDPVDPLEAATVNYVESTLLSIDSGSILSGVFSEQRLPAFTGDAESTAGSNVIYLTDTGVTAGAHPKVTVDSKGRVIGGEALTNEDIPSFSWNKITTGKPTSLEGYGITDGVNSEGDTLTGTLTIQGTPSANLHAVTKGYVDAIASSGTSYGVGDVICKVSSDVPTGFLRLNAVDANKTTYANLYAVIGDTFESNHQIGYGRPWEQQYEINTTQSAEITSWTAGTSLPATFFMPTTLVTKNYVYLLGGQVNGAVSSAVYMAAINSDGSLGTWGTTTALPINMYSKAIVTKNRVYLIGGTTTNSLNKIYTAVINSDGTLGTWSLHGTTPGDVYNTHVLVTRYRVYILGAGNNSTGNTTVYTAPIDTTGVIGSWTTGTSLPSAVSGGHLCVTKNRVYILGGGTSPSASSSSVITAPINADGTLGTWTTNTALPFDISGNSIFVTKNRVYICGTYNSNGYYSAPINADGTLGTWVAGTSLPTIRYNCGYAVIKNRFYYFGGRDYFATFHNTVYYATITGGVTDYAPYYDGTITATYSTDFRLPNYSSEETESKFYFIKY